MAYPLAIASNLSDLGRLQLATQASADDTKIRQSQALQSLMQSMQQNRLAQRQLAQKEQTDGLQAALTLASMENQNRVRRDDFANSMTAQAAQNAARMSELDRSIAGQKDIAQITAGRLDPRLFGELQAQASEIAARNQQAKAAAAAANQKLSVVNAEREAAKGKNWFIFDSGRKGYESQQDLDQQRKVANIVTELGEAGSFIQFDPVSKSFIPLLINPPRAPAPGSPSPLPVNPSPAPSPVPIPVGAPAPVAAGPPIPFQQFGAPPFGVPTATREVLRQRVLDDLRSGAITAQEARALAQQIDRGFGR